MWLIDGLNFNVVEEEDKYHLKPLSVANSEIIKGLKF
jgi:hypothetical protein